MNKISSLAFLLLFLSGLIGGLQAAEGEGEAAPKAVLKKGDITRLLETFPQIRNDFEALGQQFEGVEDLGALQAMAANSEVQAILLKYGWDLETFFPKLSAMVMGFVNLELEKQLAQLPEQQRAMMKQMMQSQQGGLSIHPNDMAMLKPFEKQLRALFESME